MSDLPEVLATVVVGPDDHLVIALADGTTPEQLEAIRAQLDERWAHLAPRVLFVVGAAQLAVIKAATDE